MIYKYNFKYKKTCLQGDLNMQPVLLGIILTKAKHKKKLE